MPVRIRLIISHLDDFGKEWIESQWGHVTPILRADVLMNARKYLANVISNKDICLATLEGLAQDVHNYRIPFAYSLINMEIRLRMYAMISWLIEQHGTDILYAIQDIANRHRCLEIRYILAGQPIT